MTTLTEKAVEAPIFPPVEVILNVGVLTEPKLKIVNEPCVVSDTDVLPLIAPASLNVPPVAVSSTV